MSAPSPVVAAPASAHPEDVYHALAAWTLHADARLLAAWAVVGWVDAAAIAVLLPQLWLVALPLISLSALGVWGLATRRLRALDAAGGAPVRRQALLAVRAAAVTIGTVAAIAAFYSALLLGMGQRWGVPGG